MLLMVVRGCEMCVCACDTNYYLKPVAFLVSTGHGVKKAMCAPISLWSTCDARHGLQESSHQAAVYLLLHKSGQQE